MWAQDLLGYQVIATDSTRFKNYSEEENTKLIEYKNRNIKNKEITILMNRSYWSKVDKLKEMRKDGLL
jgi:hypothetical protein